LLPKNINQAITYYEKAAHQGHLEAAAHLTDIFQESNPEEAKKWLIFRAEHQDVQAQLKLSKLYEEDQNYQQAILWLEKALHQLFPLTQDLSDVSPDLIRLRGML
ncbi:MAG: sel1 repeat family protein, partial [Alphaproteobacteria bacterium]|nr:sel1 repeat family protein [Alphaproteobacteria bacterium]